MQLKFASLMVADQESALRFYVDKVGFRKMADIPMGQYRWLTVASPEGVAGMELVLEPMSFAAAKEFQKAMYKAGIPATAFVTKDIAAEVRRLREAGVTFRSEPKRTGPIQSALFDDTCGNLINLVQAD
jgi:catechol 2,3-dioxygenase-like lactoylglutathione lyase family enzyme